MSVPTKPKDRRGSKPGERRGGRKAGTPGHKVADRMLEVAREAKALLDDARHGGRKLGKDVLDDFMNVFSSMAAYHQPKPVAGPDGVVRLQGGDEERFQFYAMAAMDTATRLAKYQSPTFKAIQVVAPRPDAPIGQTVVEGEIAREGKRRQVTRFTFGIFGDAQTAKAQQAERGDKTLN